MKSIIILVLTVIGQLALAQQNVYLNVSHMLGNESFAFNKQGVNDLGNGFTVNRLEYYISEITLIHDGGTQSHVDDFWILVSGGKTTNEHLGSFPITNLESIQFSVGVEPAFNHLDPAGYSSLHPLSPKSPSMHWGWTSGYRFLAMEGLSGPNTNLVFEIHALGDANYHSVSFTTAGYMDGNDLVVGLDADYEMVLKQIDISQGALFHGDTGLPAVALENCSTSVFSVSQDPSSVIDENFNSQINIYPNPSKGEVTVSSEIVGTCDVQVLDITGKVVLNEKAVNLDSYSLQMDMEGLYLINLYQSGSLISSKRVSIVR